jgi:hypothetical protein
MDSDPTLPSALVAALAVMREHGDAEAALRLTGLDLDGIERFQRVPEDVLGLVGRRSDAEALRQALALGFLAGRMAQRPRARRSLDPSSFLMDRELFVREAAGQSILRLPWFEEDLFVERRVPEISEFPRHVMRHCLEHYPAALRGERSQYRFTSYGHAYTVEVVPVRDEGKEVDGVLAIAVPARPPTGRLRRAAYWEQVGENLDDAAKFCDYRAGLYGAAGDHEAAERQRELADAARRAARRAQAKGFRYRSDGPWHRSE